MKVFSLIIHHSTQHNRKSIITTKVFSFLKKKYAFAIFTSIRYRAYSSHRDLMITDDYYTTITFALRPLGLLFYTK